MNVPRLAVVGSSNPSAVFQLRRIIRACRLRDVEVELLLADLGSRSRPDPQRFADLGVPIRWFRATPRRRGRFGYPSPLSLVWFSSRVARELDESPPACILTHVDSYGIYRILHWWAQERGVPGFVVQEGMTGILKRERVRDKPGTRPHSVRQIELGLCRLLRPNLLRDVPLYGFAERICVWGPSMRRHLIAAGRPASTITVTGSPVFDHVSERRPLADTAEPTVLFAHQHQPDSRAEVKFCRELIDVCANRLKCRLLFRPHPRSGLTGAEVGRLVHSVTDNPTLVEIVTDGDVVDLLYRASVFITFYSTSAYHAVIHGVPILLAEWVSEKYTFDAARFGAAISVAQPGELESSLRLALWDRNVRHRLYEGAEELVADHLSLLDGHASDRVAAAVEAVLPDAGAAG